MTSTPPPVAARDGGVLTGTTTLLRFMLRRDRVRLPAWVLGLTGVLVYITNTLGYVLDDEGLASFAALASNPVMVLVGGPGYGFDDITAGRFLVGLYGVYLMLGTALMSILTVSRHTRVEEQTGRAELVRANAVGRHAHLAATLVLTAAMNLVVALLMAVVFSISAIDPGSVTSSLLFTLSIGAVGMVFAAVAAVTVQLSPYSRTGSGIAGALLAAAFVMRGLGDVSHVQGGGLGWLSWLSPLGWAQQTAPLTLDRWWPLALPLVTVPVLAWAAFALESRRDLAAGMLPDRLGPAVASSWLRGPVMLVVRLQRPALMWWSVSVFVAGAVFGAFVRPLAQNADGMPEEVLLVLGSAEGIVKGYLGFMGIYFAIFTSVFALLAVQAWKGEESEVRAEPVLATSVSRARWSGAWLVVASIGTVWLLFLAGAGEGVGAAASMRDGTLVASVTLGHMVHAPAVWVLLGFGAALYGWAPRLLGLAWAVFVLSAAFVLFGDMLRLDDHLLALSVFRHIGQYPGQELSWLAAGGLTVLAGALTALGMVGFRRRDLVTT